MSFAPEGFDYSNLEGLFRECEYGYIFEYTYSGFPLEQDGMIFDKLIFVGPYGNETRHCHVLKTVVYVIVDEDEFGRYVIEKWKIKKHTIYRK